MFDYDRIQKIAEAKLTNFGSAITLRITARSSYNATLDSYAEVATDYSVYGLKRSYKNSEYGIRQGYGDLIKVGDVEYMISDNALPALLETSNISIIDGNSTWYPVRIEPLCPGGITIFYKIQAARERR